MTHEPQAAAARDGCVTYDELRAGPRRRALEPGAPAAPDGRRAHPAGPNAVFAMHEQLGFGGAGEPFYHVVESP